MSKSRSRSLLEHRKGRFHDRVMLELFPLVGAWIAGVVVDGDVDARADVSQPRTAMMEEAVREFVVNVNDPMVQLMA